MKDKKQSYMDKSNFEAIYKSSFYMERNCVVNPKPSQNYHYHNCYELYYLYSGERYYFIKDKTYHVKAGSFVLIKPYEIHSTANFEGYGYDRLLINFQKDYIKSFANTADTSALFECFENDINIITLNSRDRMFTEMILENMTKEYSDQSIYSDYLKSSLLQLMLFLNKHRLKDEDSLPNYVNSTHRTISEIIGYINNHYKEAITLSTISQQFYISACHFSRTFKKTTGLSFTEYLNNVRIKEARKLLHKKDISITRVAELTGFNNNTHFNRVFKSIMGMSPINYKIRNTR